MAGGYTGTDIFVSDEQLPEEMEFVPCIDPLDNKTFLMKNAFPGAAGEWGTYVSFQGAGKHPMRAVYNDQGAMKVTFHKVNYYKDFVYRMKCCNHGNNYWVGLDATDGYCLNVCFENEKDAIPVKLYKDTNDTYKMQSMWNGQATEGKWVSLRESGAWLMANHAMNDAMPIKLEECSLCQQASKFKLKVVGGDQYTSTNMCLNAHKFLASDTRDGASVYAMACSTLPGAVFEYVTCHGGFKLKIVDGDAHTQTNKYLAVHKFHAPDTRDDASVYAMCHTHESTGAVFQEVQCDGGFKLKIVDGDQYTFKNSYLAVHKFHKKDTRDDFSVWVMAHTHESTGAVFSCV